MMVSKIKPIFIDQICGTCINELKRGHRVEVRVYETDQHGWDMLTCKHYTILWERGSPK